MESAICFRFTAELRAFWMSKLRNNASGEPGYVGGAMITGYLCVAMDLSKYDAGSSTITSPWRPDLSPVMWKVRSLFEGPAPDGRAGSEEIGTAEIGNGPVTAVADASAPTPGPPLGETAWNSDDEGAPTCPTATADAPVMPKRSFQST